MAGILWVGPRRDVEKVDQDMTQVESPEVRFTDPEAPELSDYRPVDRWVVLAIIASLLSFFAFLIPTLWIIPLVATLLSVAAIRSVLDESRPTMGRKGAMFALFLSLFILGCAPMRHATLIWHTSRQARIHADSWLELIREGRLPEAHQLTLSLYTRVGEGVNLEEHYRSPGNLPPADPEMGMMPAMHPSQELELYFGKAGIKEIVEAAPEVEFEFVRVAKVDLTSIANSRVAELRYVARYTKDGKLQRADLRILMERTMLPHSGLTHWRVYNFDNLAFARD
jgi:hypothetical protein